MLIIFGAEGPYRRLPNSSYRPREYLTEAEVGQLIEATRKPGEERARDAAAVHWASGACGERGCIFRSSKSEQPMAREELKWHNIDADDLPATVKKSFDVMVEAEAAFKADLEKLLKTEGHMPEDKFLVLSRKGKRLGVSYASTLRGEGGAGSLKFKTK